MPKRVVIPFFTDENVPASVGRALQDAKHGLTRLRDVMEEGTPDPVIAVACAEGNQVLVTNDPDFKAIARRLKITKRQYHNKLHRVHLRCDPPKAKDRIIDALSLIEHEWGLVREGHPMVIEITNVAIRTLR